MSNTQSSPILSAPISPEKKFEKTLATLIIYHRKRFVNGAKITLNLSYSPTIITLYDKNMDNGIEIRNHNITRSTFEKVITLDYEVRPKYPTSNIIQVTYRIPKDVIPDTTIVYTISGILNTLACIDN